MSRQEKRPPYGSPPWAAEALKHRPLIVAGIIISSRSPATRSPPSRGNILEMSHRHQTSEPSGGDVESGVEVEAGQWEPQSDVVPCDSVPGHHVFKHLELSQPPPPNPVWFHLVPKLQPGTPGFVSNPHSKHPASFGGQFRSTTPYLREGET
jgi:hypothetical protein